MARLRQPEPESRGESTMTPEIASRIHPIWKNPDAVRERLAEWVTVDDFESDLRFRRLHTRVLQRWCEANGYTDENRRIDYRRLRANEPLMNRG